MKQSAVLAPLSIRVNPVKSVKEAALYSLSVSFIFPLGSGF